MDGKAYLQSYRTFSAGHVASWGSGKEVPELKSSLETIRATSNELINSITDVMQERTKEQEKTAEQPDKSNIIGNTAYSAIEDKQYFRLKSETAEKVEKHLTDNNIPFSGRINSDKTTLTIGQKNIEDYKSAVADVTGKHFFHRLYYVRCACEFLTVYILFYEFLWHLFHKKYFLSDLNLLS